MIKLHPDHQDNPEKVLGDKVSPMHRLMTEGQQSLFWKTVVEEIDKKIKLESNIEGITQENLDVKRGMVRAYRVVLGMPDVLKEREE